jgi:hypothetical protein
MTSFGLTPTFVGLTQAPFFTPIPPFRGDIGLGGNFGVEGSIGEVPLPPVRPAGLTPNQMARGLIIGAMAVYDFEYGYFAHRFTGPSAASRWTIRDTFGGAAVPDAQAARLRLVAAQLSQSGIDLLNAFTIMNIESVFARDLNNDPFFGPFQYGQDAMNGAFDTEDVVYNLNDITKTTEAFVLDSRRFPELARRRGLEYEGWMHYAMHQQGPNTGLRVAQYAIEQPNMLMRTLYRRLGVPITNLTGQAQEILQGANTNTLTVSQYKTLMVNAYTRWRDGSTGQYARRPVTDFIEQRSVSVLRGPTVTLDVLNLIQVTENYAPYSTAALYSPGVGIDLRQPSPGPGLNYPGITYIGALADDMNRLGTNVMIEVEWAADPRLYGPTSPGDPPQQAIDPKKYFISGGRYGSFSAETSSAAGSQDVRFADSNLGYTNDPDAVYMIRCYPAPLNDPAPGLSFPYGRGRIAYRRNNDVLTFAVNGSDPIVIADQPMELIEGTILPPNNQSRGYMVIKKIVCIPDDPNPIILKTMSDLNFKVGTEPAS